MGIELLINSTKSHVFTVLPTANQMNWSQMELSRSNSQCSVLASFCRETQNITSNQGFMRFGVYFLLDMYVCSVAHIIHEIDLL